MSMIRSAIVAGGVGAALSVGVATSASAQGVSPAASSSAYGIQADFTADNMSTALGPVAPVGGSAPPAYSKTKVVTSYVGSVAIPPLVPGAIHPIVASLTASAAMLRSHVASAGIQIDNVSAVGTSSIDAASLRIANSQPVPPPFAPGFLRVVANGVQASASYAKVFPSAASVSGSASFGSLSITGSLVGGTTITYAGSAPANTVLYQSPTVTITAHQQIIAGVISCPPCVFAPVSVTVRALDISLDKAVIDGRMVSGDIVLGDAAAE